MNISKKTAGMLAVLGLAAGSVLTLGLQTHAQTTTSTSSSNPIQNLVNAIAARFNLNVADVQQVFDQQKSQMDVQHQQMEANRIQQLVTDGKLTQDQADKIVAKRKEIQTFMETLKDKTQADRDAAIKSEMGSLKTWATDNNIPQQYVMMFGGHHGGFGMPGRGVRANDNDADDAPAAAPSTNTVTN